MATIKDIAEKLGISISTVSKGLNGASDVSHELRETIIDTAVAMGYSTKRMKREDNKKLAILIAHIDYESNNNFGYDIVLGFKQAAFHDNWNVDIHPLDINFETREKFENFMLKNGYSGAFALCLSLNDPWMEQIKTSSIPVTLLDNHIPQNPNTCYVGTDNYEGIEAAIRHLVGLGHTKIAFLNGDKDSMISELREQAYWDGLRANNLPADRMLIANDSFTDVNTKKHLPALLENGATAILCGNDLIAYDVIRECNKLGLKVPEDISVIGFDDLPTSSEGDTSLTSVRQDRIDLGKCGYLALHGLINRVPIGRLLLRPELIVRNSTAKVVDR